MRGREIFTRGLYVFRFWRETLAERVGATPGATIGVGTGATTHRCNCLIISIRCAGCHQLSPFHRSVRTRTRRARIFASPFGTPTIYRVAVANIYKCATKLSSEMAAVLTAKIRATIIWLPTPGAIPWRVSSLSVIHDVDSRTHIRFTASADSLSAVSRCNCDGAVFGVAFLKQLLKVFVGVSLLVVEGDVYLVQGVVCLQTVV